MQGLKVLVLANDTTYAFNLRDELLERLVSDGNEVVVASQPLLYQEELKGMGCRLIDIETNRHGKNPLSDLGLLSKFKKILKAEKPDIVLTYNIKPNVYGGMACKSLKIRYIPNITGLGTAVEYPGMMQKIITRLTAPDTPPPRFMAPPPMLQYPTVPRYPTAEGIPRWFHLRRAYSA